jgi:hypothetical protein
MRGARSWQTIVGAVLALVYVVPVFVPPPAVWPGEPAAGSGWVRRVFPDVPAVWVVVRLLALFAGAILLAWSARRHLAAPPPRGATVGGPDEVRVDPAAMRLRVALGLALLQALAGLYTDDFSLAMELTYLLALPLPAVLLLAPDGPTVMSGLRRHARGTLLLLALPVLWSATNVAVMWRSPMAASSVDMWLMVERLGNVASGREPLLGHGSAPGLTNAYMVLEGVWLLDAANPEPSFAVLQILHAVWATLLALVTGAMARALCGPAAALVAQGVVLWSPYVVSSLVSAGPLIPICVLPLTLVWLWWAVRDRRSAAALAGFGALAGFTATHPSLVPGVAVLVALMAVTVFRQRPVPWLALATGVFGFLAARLPGLPDSTTIGMMADQFASARGRIHAVVRILLGQDSPHSLREALSGGASHALDLPLGALLSPFAIARSPLRLWGDVLLEPIATVLVAVGLVLVTTAVRRDGRWWGPLAVIATSLLAGMTSSGDFVSYTRVAPALGALALVASLGFASMRAAMAGARSSVGVARSVRVAIACVGAMAVSGTIVFHVVNPSILPASWLATGLEALGPRPTVRATVVEDGGPPYYAWLNVRRIAALLPAPPLGVRTHDVLAEAPDPGAARDPDVLLWSPAVEHDVGVAAAVCRRWPRATLYELRDRAGLFRTHAAALPGVTWHPDVSASRWTATRCPSISG